MRIISGKGEINKKIRMNEAGVGLKRGAGQNITQKVGKDRLNRDKIYLQKG